MPFPVQEQSAKDLRTAIMITKEIKAILLTAKKELSGGAINADEVIAFLRVMKLKYTALVAVQSRLNLGTTDADTLGEDLQSLLLAVGSMVQWVAVNMPSSAGYLLLHRIDENFNLVPREFTGTTVAALDNRVNLILQEIE